MLMRKIYTLSVLGLFCLQAVAQIPEYCLENDAAHRYLTEVQYDPNDYTYTKITDYCDPVPYQYYKYDGYRKDQPLPVTLTIDNPLDTVSTLFVSEFEDFYGAWEFTLEKGVTSYDVYNLIPGKTYNWKVQYSTPLGETVTAKSGRFKTTGTLRMLKIDNVFNVRDMGGWIGLGGNPIKYGKLIRGSRLNKNGSSTKIITADGINELRRIGIKAELDLRNNSDAAGATYSFLGSDIPIKNIENAYGSRISTFSDKPQSIQGIKQVIAWLKQDKPIYFHCSVGADRTGTVAYLIGALCGMSEDELCKEFELTSFSADSIVTSGRQEDLRRRRTYEGRFDPNDNPASYQFATMVDKIKSFPGDNLMRKVYYHLSTGAKYGGGTLGESIPEDDLVWLISYLTDYVIVKTISTDGGATLTLEPGQTHNLNAKVVPDNATVQDITYKSLDERVATVSDAGVITAVRGGTTKIQIQADDYVKTVTVSVPLVESEVDLPDTIFVGNSVYLLPKSSTNLIKNGSFEYANSFLNWRSAANKELTSAAFDLVEYPAGNGVYIQSKADGDESSFKSLRTMWSIQKGKSYVFGFKVKNSQAGKQSVNNPNLSTSLISLKSAELDAGADDFSWDDAQMAPMRAPESAIDSLNLGFATYGDEWTDVRYYFTNTDGYQYLQVWFTHLSDGTNNTCLDNFYLLEVTDITWVNSILSDSKTDDRIFNLAGQEVVNPGRGVYIKNGKKYIVK